MTRLDIWLFEILHFTRGASGTPFWGKGGRRGHWIVPLERAMVVFYTLYNVTIALSVTIGPQFAIECLRRSNQQGWVTLGQYFRMFALE